MASFFLITLFLALNLLMSCVRGALNVTIRPAAATLTGSWTCSQDQSGNGVGFNACDLGCRTSTVGDSMSITFQGSAAWMTLQQSSSTDLVLTIQLDGAETRFATFNDVAPGCYNNVFLGASLDQSQSHTLTVTVRAASAQDSFIFGGLTVTTDTTSGVSNTPPQPTKTAKATSAQLRSDRIGVIIGVIGGVIAFWLILGVGVWYVRSARRERMLQPRRGQLATIDMSSDGHHTVIAGNSTNSLIAGRPSFSVSELNSNIETRSMVVAAQVSPFHVAPPLPETLTKWEREMRELPGASRTEGPSSQAIPPPVYTPRMYATDADFGPRAV